MKKRVLLLFLFAINSISCLKVLHVSFHKGCINEFEEVARELNLEVTSWYLLSDELRGKLDGKTRDNEIYNITRERAARAWQIHRNFFNTFDVIITSDTAPLSRIFLQNPWNKPLIIWVCNRFDYAHGVKSGFPDREYYELFKKAKTKKNVTVISYTPYEWFYAKNKGVDIGTFTIKPIGSLEQGFRNGNTSAIPPGVDQEKTLFINPRGASHRIRDECKKVGIKTFSGAYNGPNDLLKFKGIIFIPYAWSNLSLFENIARGLINFVPTTRFLKEMRTKNIFRHWPGFNAAFDQSEWYRDEYKDLFIFFDSFVDLKQKMETLDYQTMKKRIKEAGLMHRCIMLERWSKVFDDCCNFLKK